MGLPDPAHPPQRDAAAGHDGGQPVFGFEPRDANARSLALAMAGLALGVAIVIGLMFGLLGYFHAQNTAARPDLSPQQQAAIEPPEPNLQANPYDDLRRLREREESQLHLYQWLDASHTEARIPIERAIALTAGRPLDGDAP